MCELYFLFNYWLYYCLLKICIFYRNRLKIKTTLTSKLCIHWRSDFCVLHLQILASYVLTKTVNAFPRTLTMSCTRLIMHFQVRRKTVTKITIENVFRTIGLCRARRPRRAVYTGIHLRANIIAIATCSRRRLCRARLSKPNRSFDFCARPIVNDPDDAVLRKQPFRPFYIVIGTRNCFPTHRPPRVYTYIMTSSDPLVWLIPAVPYVAHHVYTYTYNIVTAAGGVALCTRRITRGGRIIDQKSRVVEMPRRREYIRHDDGRSTTRDEQEWTRSVTCKKKKKQKTKFD